MLRLSIEGVNSINQAVGLLGEVAEPMGGLGEVFV
jgi:hypothetical protein